MKYTDWFTLNDFQELIEMLRDGVIYRGIALETIPSFLFALKLIKRIKQYDIGSKNEKA